MKYLRASLMTNEMKLITALCERLGFEVEKVCVNKEEMVKYAMATFFDVKPIYEYKLTTPIVKVDTVDKPFTKLNESDEIFNTEMFGEVRISRSMEYGTRIDTKKNGQYFTNFVDDSVCISYVIRFMDCMYSAREKA
jgi:hypothetical protein